MLNCMKRNSNEKEFNPTRSINVGVPSQNTTWNACLGPRCSCRLWGRQRIHVKLEGMVL
jgi:hypothetical protein